MRVHPSLAYGPTLSEDGARALLNGRSASISRSSTTPIAVSDPVTPHTASDPISLLSPALRFSSRTVGSLSRRDARLSDLIGTSSSD